MAKGTSGPDAPDARGDHETYYIDCRWCCPCQLLVTLAHLPSRQCAHNGIIRGQPFDPMVMIFMLARAYAWRAAVTAADLVTAAGMERRRDRAEVESRWLGRLPAGIRLSCSIRSVPTAIDPSASGRLLELPPGYSVCSGGEVGDAMVCWSACRVPGGRWRLRRVGGCIRKPISRGSARRRWCWRSCANGYARVRRSLVDQIVSAYLKQLGRDRPVKPWSDLLQTPTGRLSPMR